MRDTELPQFFRDDVLARLGFEAPPAPTLDALREIYAAWCASVPFDNVRKMIALNDPVAAELPGVTATDFFEAWLIHGCGGTCWPSSNALLVLLRSLGFSVQRTAGSMRDSGEINHESVRVRIDSEDWLADTSMLTNVPLPLGPGVYSSGDPIYGFEVEAVDDTHVVWFYVPPHTDFYPCRILGPIDREEARRKYTETRARSPFNDRLYARRNYPDRMVVLRERTLYEKTAAGVTERRLQPNEIRVALIEDIGISELLADHWVRSGALRRLVESRALPVAPPVNSVRPSLRLT